MTNNKDENKNITHSNQGTQKFSILVYVEKILKLFALLVILTSLFGYGVLAGLSDSAGLVHGSMLSSPLESLYLAWPGIMMLQTALQEIDILRLLREYVWFYSNIAVIVFFIVIFKHYKNKILFWKIPGNDWLKRKIIPKVHDNFCAVLHKAFLSVLLSLIAFFMFIFSAISIVYLTLISIVTVPILGYFTGYAYFEKHVLKPQNCYAIQSSADRIKNLGKKRPSTTSVHASCVLISSVEPNNSYRNYGRVIVNSSSYMLLYHMDTGVGERLPIANFRIQNIDDSMVSKLEKEKQILSTPSSKD